MQKDYDEARGILTKIEAYEEQIQHYSSRLEEYKGKKEEEVGKDTIALFEDSVNKSRKGLSEIEGRREWAKQKVAEYEESQRTLADRIKEAEDDALKLTRDDYRDELRRQAIQDRKDRFEADQLKKYKDDARAKYEARNNRPHITEYKRVAKQNFNKDVEEAIEDVKNNSKENIYKIGVYKKLTPEEFDVSKLNEQDLAEAGQVYDRIFMKLNTVYDKHNIGFITDSSVTSRMYVSKTKIGDKKIKDVLLQPFMYEKLAQYGIDADKIETRDLVNYEKAFVLYTMVHQNAKIEFRPSVFDDKGNFTQVQSGHPQYTLDVREVSGLVEDPATLSSHYYEFLTFNQMKSLEPYYEEPVAEDPVPEKEEMDPEHAQMENEVWTVKRDLDFGYGAMRYMPENDPDWTPIDERIVKSKKEYEEQQQADNYTVISYLEHEDQENAFLGEQKELNDEGFSTAPRQDEERAESGLEKAYSGKVEENKAKIIEEYMNKANGTQKKAPDPNKPVNQEEKVEEDIVADEPARFRLQPRLDDKMINPRAQNILARHEDKGPISKHEFFDLLSALGTFEDQFADYKDEIRQLADEATQAFGTLVSGGAAKRKLPGGTELEYYGSQEQQIIKAKLIAKFDELLACIDHSETRKAEENVNRKYLEPYKQEHLELFNNDNAKYQEGFSEFKKKHPIEKEMNLRLVNILRTTRDVIVGYKLDDINRLDPEFLNTITSTMATFPYNMFLQEDGTFKPDDEKYEALMAKFPFIDQIEDRLDFMTKVYLPYITSKNAGNLTPASVAEFNKKYTDFQERQLGYFRKLSSLSQEDINEISKLKAFNENVNKSLENWTGVRFGKAVIRNANRAINLVDRGWPAEDINFFSDLLKMASELKGIKEDVNATPQDKQQAEQILKDMQDSYIKMKTGYVTSPEMRDEILDNLAKPIQDYVSWKGQDSTITVSYIEAANRKCPLEELGRQLKVVDTKYIFNQEELSVKAPAGMNSKQIKDNVDIMVKDLKAVEITLGSGAFKDMKNALLDLQRFVNRDMMRIAPREGQTVEQAYYQKMQELKRKINATKNATNAYFDKKQNDFNHDANRRDSARKQGVEQSRIKMALNLYDKLILMENRLAVYEFEMKNYHFIEEQPVVNENAPEDVQNFQRTELPALKKNARDRLLDLALNAEKEASGALNRQEYEKAVAKMLIYNLQRKSGYFNKSENESLEDYRRRIETLGTRELTNEEIETAKQTDQNLSAVLNDVVNDFGANGTARVKFSDAICLYAVKASNEAVPNEARNLKVNRGNRAQEIKSRKENLLSENNRQLAQEKAQNKGHFAL